MTVGKTLDVHGDVTVADRSRVVFLSQSITVIRGDMSLNPSSTIELQGVSNQPIQVSGCVRVDGNLEVKLKPTDLDRNIEVVRSGSGCVNGSFDAITGQIPSQTTSCNQVHSSQRNNGNALSVVFTLEDSGCESETDSIIPGMAPGAALAVVIVIPILLIIIVAAVIIIAVPRIRRKVIPFADRKFFQGKASKTQVYAAAF
jgi:hypothetical protein